MSWSFESENGEITKAERIDEPTEEELKAHRDEFMEMEAKKQEQSMKDRAKLKKAD